MANHDEGHAERVAAQGQDGPAEDVQEPADELREVATDEYEGELATLVVFPGIGRIVHYCVDENEGDHVLVPAIVTALRDDDRVDVRIFATPGQTPFAHGARVHTDAAGYYAENVREGDIVGTFRWPVIGLPIVELPED